MTSTASTDREVRIKALYRVIDERAAHDQPPLLSVSIHHGVVRRDSVTDDLPRAEDLSNYKICGRGDLVLNRMRAFQGAIGISPQRGLVSPDYLVLRPNRDVEARYLHHLFRSTWFVGEMVARLRGIGSTEQGNVRTPRINAEDLGDIRVKLPALEEQRRIADFLDTETARIDQMVNLQHKVLTRLQERDTAVLDAELERLASEAGTLPLRRYVVGVDQGASPQCEAIPAAEGEWGVLKVSCLRPGEFFPDENKRLPEGSIPNARHEVHQGDLLITRANTPQLVGATAAVPSIQRKLLLSDKIFRVRILPSLDPQYVTTVARGSRVRNLCSAVSNGASQSMANIRFEEVKEWPIPAATLNEQRDLVIRMNSLWDVTRQLRTKIQHQLSLLGERRQALITAAVTGQIDISTASGRGVTEGVSP